MNNEKDEIYGIYNILYIDYMEEKMRNQIRLF